MSPTEVAYLTAFRNLSVKRDQIRADVAALNGIVTTLKDWQTTAASIRTTGHHAGQNAEWSMDRLSNLANLRNALVEYDVLRQQTDQAWGQLNDAEKVGLASPAALSDSPK